VCPFAAPREFGAGQKYGNRDSALLFMWKCGKIRANESVQRRVQAFMPRRDSAFSKEDLKNIHNLVLQFGII
jgi:hypothetical protein